MSRATRPLRRVRGTDLARLRDVLRSRAAGWWRAPGCRPAQLRVPSGFQPLVRF